MEQAGEAPYLLIARTIDLIVQFLSAVGNSLLLAPGHAVMVALDVSLREVAVAQASRASKKESRLTKR